MASDVPVYEPGTNKLKGWARAFYRSGQTFFITQLNERGPSLNDYELAYAYNTALDMSTMRPWSSDG